MKRPRIYSQSTINPVKVFSTDEIRSKQNEKKNEYPNEYIEMMFQRIRQNNRQ